MELVSTVGNWIVGLGVLVAVIGLIAYAVKYFISKQTTTTATTTTISTVADKVMDYADEATALPAITALAILCKKRGDTAGITLCAQLWTQILRWSVDEPVTPPVTK